MNEYRIKVTVRNNLLLSAIENAGYAGHGGLSRFAAAAGLHQNVVSSMLSMRQLPIGNEGEFSIAAKAIMETLGAAPTDLWTDRQLNTRLVRNTGQFTVTESALQAVLEDHQEAMALPDPHAAAEEKSIAGEVANILDTTKSLTAREAKVLRLRYGIGGCEEHTMQQIADIYGLSLERIRQIEAKALRKLRHPTNAVRFRSLDDSVANAVASFEKVGIDCTPDEDKA
jgi:RNA polymerase sigma factor (sigma-70 family)